MAKRTKKIVVQGVTPEQLDAAMAAYAAADAEMVKINAQLDVEFTRLREQHADRLAALEKQRAEAFETVQVYATENRDVLFAKRKSAENAHGVFGFRTGTPKLKPARGFTWSAVLDLAKELAPAYVRTTAELAKDRLLADRESPEVADLMTRIRVTVAQDETFFIELKKETTE